MKSLVDGFVELGLLVVQNVEDEVFFLFKFRISVFGAFDYACGKAGKEQSVNAKQTAMTCCTADQTAQYVALPSLVGMIPSEIMNVAERIWSVIRRMETSVS